MVRADKKHLRVARVFNPCSQLTHGLPTRATGIVACSLTLLLNGCGYEHGTTPTTAASSGYHWSSTFRQDVRTVAVPIFSNRDYQRGVELSLTKAVINQIEARTPYKVVSRDHADTILEGEIVSISVNTLSEDRLSAIPQEQLLDITVNFTWKDLRTGRILMSRRGWEQTASYYPTLGEGRATGTQSAAEKLAIAIVNQLEAEW